MAGTAGKYQHKDTPDSFWERMELIHGYKQSYNPNGRSISRHDIEEVRDSRSSANEDSPLTKVTESGSYQSGDK